jgi:hypothetical protein
MRNPASSRKHLKIDADETVRTVDMKWYMPFARRMGITYPNGHKQSIVSVGTPIDNGRCQIVQWSYRKDSEADLPAADIITFSTKTASSSKSSIRT